MANLGDARLHGSERIGTLNAEVEEDADLAWWNQMGRIVGYMLTARWQGSPSVLGGVRTREEPLYFLAGRVATIMFLTPS
jgi:hypothetical protein